MPTVPDHIFICTSPGAPAAELLTQLGLTEGAANRHPGQGTACRRFFFSNDMLELLWMEDETEARGEQTRATRLADRFSGLPKACPFGVVLKPAPGTDAACPWPSWTYRPSTMPGLELEIAEDTSLAEPMWCFMKVAGPRRAQPMEHPAGLREITGIRITGPSTRTIVSGGLIELQTGEEYLLELEFDRAAQCRQRDFRPALPLIVSF